MNNKQITKLMQSHVATRTVLTGVYAKDTLPEEPVKHRPAAYIVNTDVSTSSGEHWISIYFPKNGPTEYFDSFGIEPCKRFEMFMKSNYKHSISVLQNPLTTTCGQYCIFFIYMRYVCGVSMEDIISQLLTRISDIDNYVNSFIEHIFGENLDVIDVKFIQKHLERIK